MANQPDSENIPNHREPPSLADIAVRSQRLISSFLERQRQHAKNGRNNDNEHQMTTPPTDPMGLGKTIFQATTSLMADPAKLMRSQMALLQDYRGLWQNTAQRMWGQDSPPIIEPEIGDRRFSHEDWNDSEVFSFIKQSYLLNARWLQNTVQDIEGLDPQTAKKANFFTRQFVNALSPTNFALTNPEVLRKTFETRGENLMSGLQNLLTDLEQGDGRLKIKMTDPDAFDVGRNIASTPGKVVFRNDLFELIQYTPTTKSVNATPLLLITPWINKFYVLDMQPKNSLIHWLVEQGHTVFVTSWVNPDGNLADKTFADYMTEGAIEAIDAVTKATGVNKINVTGYCIGGTLLAATLAYMAAKKINTVQSATFLTTLVDFTEVGDLGVFIDDDQVDQLEEKMNQHGYLEGHEMARTFNMLRENDLIWSFVINNYLLGNEPLPFDLLYWNSDSTRLPATMHSFYLREMYIANKLVRPCAIELAGVPIDLSNIKVPTYILSTREDHIAPWTSTFAATNIYQGPVKFVLAASGHIAGVVNPPASQKYGHWTNTKKADDPDAWFDGATEHVGSWWPDWDKWLGQTGAKTKVPARMPGKGKLKSLGDAPGTYVMKKA